MQRNQNIVVVSADNHVGPLLNEQLRAYCPRKHRRDFDEFAEQDRAYRRAVFETAPEQFYRLPTGEWAHGGRNQQSAGHYDVHARLRDMDFDGITAEVIFHGSTNDEPMPFT